MKRFILALALIAGLSLPAFARGWNIRLEAGGNANNITESASGYKAAYGYQAGAALELALVKGVYIAPGVTFSRASSKSGIALPGADIFPELRADNLQIPLTLGVRFKPVGVLGISLEAGPYISYTLDSNETIGETARNILDGLSTGDRIAWGVGASAAFEISVVYLRAGIQKGLNKPTASAMYSVLRDALQMGSARDANLYLTLGLRF